jgi:hypothetical protein
MSQLRSLRAFLPGNANKIHEALIVSKF